MHLCTHAAPDRSQLACTVCGGFGVWQESYLNRLADGHLDAQLQSEAGEV